MFQDLRFAFRTLLKKPGFAAIIIITLSLGIGANAAVFSIVDALILRPFPIPDIDRIAMIWETLPERGVFRNSAAPANFLDWQEQATAFEELKASIWWDVNITGDAQPERLQGTLVTPGFLRILGVEAPLGRTFVPEDAEREQRTVFISNSLWARRFGSDPAILGRTVRLNGIPHEVVGVAPAGFEYPYGSEVWAAIRFSPEDREDRLSHYLQVVGRLKEGRMVEDAQSDLDLISQRLAQQFPASNEGWSVRVVSLSRAVIDIGAPAFLAVWQATVVFVLLIACVNVANMLLAKGADRQAELSVRLALGASRWRIVRQLLSENLLLSVIGAGLALPLAWLGIDLMRSSLPANIRRFVVGWDQINVDMTLIGFTMLIAVVASGLFGVLPALWASRPDLNASLKEGGRGGDSGGRQRGRSILVIAEVALALMLIVVATLSIQGTMRMIDGDQGYDPMGLMTMEITLPSSGYEEPQKQVQFFEDVLRGVRSGPTVVSADVTTFLPSSGSNTSRAYEVDGNPIEKMSDRPFADFRVVSEGFFDTMRIPVLQGRAFGPADQPESDPVVVISAKLAERGWPGISPLGKRLAVGTGEDREWLTVVGVVGDVKQDWFFGDNQPTTFYRPLAQNPRRGMHLAIRTRGEPTDITPLVRAEVLRVDPNQPIYNIFSMRRILSDKMIGLKYASSVMGVFGVIALLLSVVGIYGLMTYSVSRRLHEIGIRMALGAGHREVLLVTVGNAFKITLMGVAVGLVLAWGAGTLMENNLFGTVSLNVPTLLVMASFLAAVSLLAGYVPARRALAVHPADALRVE